VVAPLIRSARPRPGIPGPLVRHLPALDGLRAVAVVAVIAYHAELSWAPGGFLGVELFFVVSGFLITSLLLAEVEARGYVDLRDFWMRRARRLLPALFVLLAVVSVAGRFLAPENVGSTRSGLLSAVTYVTNWHLIFTDVSYFEAIGRPPLLQHLWSLAVEEQYYLLWPLAVAGLVAVGGRRAVSLACAAGVVASTALMWAIVDPNSPSRVYYGTDTRAAGILLGALFATTMVAVERPRPGPRLALAIEAAGVVAFGAVVWLMATTSEFDTSLYRGGFLKFAALTTVVIAATSVPGSMLAWLLSFRGLRWIGVRSYSLYLWHWPVFQVTRPDIDVPLDGLALLALRLGITVVLADLSYRLVEEPIRRGTFQLRLAERLRFSGRSTNPARKWAVACSAVVGAVAISVSGAASSSGEAQAWEAPELEVDPTEVPAISIPLGGWQLPDTTTTTPPDESADTGDAEEDPDGGEADESAGAGDETSDPADAATPPDPVTPPPTDPPPPVVTPPPATGVTVHAVGDSVLLAIRDALSATLGGAVRIDGAVGRQPWDGVPMIQEWAAAHPGEHLVVVLGSNGILRPEHVDQIMAAAGTERRVVFVTAAVPRRWEGPTNDTLRSRVPAYPNARLVEWNHMVATNPGYVGDDRIHPTREGAIALSSAIAFALL
jgi:peptidoglycan/LPS O-acetylase OafA/YrhL